MRLTVNLEPELYALAKSLAKAEDCSISAAVNKLLRRSLSGSGRRGPKGRERSRRNRILVSHGKRPITADLVRAVEAEDDEA
jgi:hypothetical protein